MAQDNYRPNRQLKKQLEAYIAARLTRVGNLVSSAAKASMTQGGAPSRPGQPPAVQTGTLRSSITSEVRLGELSVFIGVDGGSPATKYAAALEFGTSRMEPRPYLRPAILKNKDKIIRILTI